MYNLKEKGPYYQNRKDMYDLKEKGLYYQKR